MTKCPAPETGKPLQLPAHFHFTPLMNTDDLRDCWPPNSGCPSVSIRKLLATSHLPEIAALVWEIASTKKQSLNLRVEIAAGGYENLLFVTEQQTVPVQTGRNTLVGLDPKAAKAAQPFFVSGNTVTLAVQPKDACVTVKVGKIVNHGDKKADHPRRGSR